MNKKVINPLHFILCGDMRTFPIDAITCPTGEARFWVGPGLQCNDRASKDSDFDTNGCALVTSVCETNPTMVVQYQHQPREEITDREMQIFLDEVQYAWGIVEDLIKGVHIGIDTWKKEKSPLYIYWLVVHVTLFPTEEGLLIKIRALEGPYDVTTNLVPCPNQLIDAHPSYRELSDRVAGAALVTSCGNAAYVALDMH